MQLIHQYFIRQLVHIGPFTNILPHQNFPTYDMHALYALLLYGP